MNKHVCLLVITGLVGGCLGGDEEQQEPPPPVEVTAKPYRFWEFFGRNADGSAESLHGGGESAGGEVLDHADFGGLTLAPPGYNNMASGQVYANDTGTTYWVDTEAPIGNSVIPGERIGSETFFVQYQDYRKRAANATLKLVITEATVQALDFNGSAVAYGKCPWADLSEAAERCFDGVVGHLSMGANLFVKDAATGALTMLAHYTGVAQVSGWADNWSKNVATYSRHAIFRDAQFEFEKLSSSGIGGEVGATLRLRQAVVVPIDLSQIPVAIQRADGALVGGEFSVHVGLNVTAHNRRGRESYVGARLRDPVNTGGTTLEATGLDALDTPKSDQPIDAGEPTPECSAQSTAPPAGTVQFSAASYLEPEFGSAAPVVFVTREGGSVGRLVVTASTSDGTATAGAHYSAVSRSLVFEDGDSEQRAVKVPVINDDGEGGDRTVNLTLSAVNGCATLGEVSTATLTIVDDEHRVPEDTYTVSGTVTGLTGSGLVLREVRSGIELSPSNGPFTIAYAYPDAADYELRIATQPENSRQVCDVSAGQGVIAGADVSDIVVTCAMPPSGATLDPSFGEGGRVTTGLAGAGRALALQSDGKIVAISSNTLARFNTDGSLDSSFGNGGTTPIVFTGALGEEARDLAVLANDAIVVVGQARSVPTTLNYDFAIARYNADGTLDASFGSNGRVAVDFYGEADRAYRVVLQNDGRIVVGGHSSLIDRTGSVVVQHVFFAAARLNPDGTLDTGFASDGTPEALGGLSIPFALALQPDGKVLLGGRHGADGAAVTDIGMVRFGADGQLDNEEDSDPEVWFGELKDGRYIEAFFGTGAEVSDLVIGADGGIYASVRGLEPGGTRARFLLVQFDSRGTNFLVTQAPIGPGDDLSNALALQSDGKFIVVGSASSASTFADFGMVRFNADRTIDTTFGTNGVLTVDFFGAADGAEDVAIQPDGRILAIGSARNGTRTGMGLVRILP